MHARMVYLARRVAKWIFESEAYVLLPCEERGDGWVEDVGIVVLFRARREGGGEGLVERVNASGEVVVSGTVWGGRGGGEDCGFELGG